MTAGLRSYVAPVSFGLGDLLVSLPPVQGLIAAGWETWLVARAASQEELAHRIDGLCGVVRDVDFDPAAAQGSYFNLRDHPLQTRYWWGSVEFERVYGRLGINEILARICADLGVPAEFSQPVPLLASPRAEASGTVLLVTGSDGPAKQWPSECWLALVERMRGTGLEARVVLGGGGLAEELRTAGVAGVDASTLGDAVDWLSGCRAVVGVDTGLTHIAVQQGTPTVAIHRGDAIFFRPWGHCRVVTGERCDPECLRRIQQVSHNEHVDRPAAAWRPWACAVGGRCLAAISPDAVFAALKEVLDT